MPKTVLITGASRGIGFTCAEMFARRGYNVFANYNKTSYTLPPLAAVLTEEGFSLTPVFADVSRSSDVDKMFEQVGEVDILINNAGIADFRMLCDINESDWDRIFDVNLKSAYLCSRRASESMVRKKYGRIINISSVWGIVGGSCESHYSASKAGLIGFTKALAKELGPSGITVNCISPGVIETEMNSRLSEEDKISLREATPLGRLGTCEDVAKAALFFAEADFITGENLSVGGGFGM